MQTCQEVSHAACAASSSKGFLSELMPLHRLGTLGACVPGLQRLLPAGPARQMLAGRCPGCCHWRCVAHNAGSCPSSPACGIGCCACLDACAASTPSCCACSVSRVKCPPSSCACSHVCASCAASRCACSAAGARCKPCCGWRCLPHCQAACSGALRLQDLPAGQRCSWAAGLAGISAYKKSACLRTMSDVFLLKAKEAKQIPV